MERRMLPKKNLPTNWRIDYCPMCGCLWEDHPQPKLGYPYFICVNDSELTKYEKENHG